MDLLYRKMYATLVGRVDGTLALLADCLIHDRCDREHTRQAAEQLKAALLEAEETYLSAAEEPEEEESGAEVV